MGLSTLSLWFLMYWRLFAAILTLILLAAAIVRWWAEVRFLAMRMWYSFPLIGKARRLSRNISVDGENWFQSELTLCSEFKSHLDRIVSDPEMYNKAKSYLAKVHEIGRKPLSLFGWALITFLVFIESLGFAYVLAGYTLPGASEALQIPGAFAISALISVILVFLTHLGGQEWHQRSLVKKARIMWLHDEPKDQRKNLIGMSPARLDLDEEDDVDASGKKEKPYIQLIRRLDTNATSTPGTPWWNIVMVIAILFIALGAFYVRYQTFKRDQTCVTMTGSSPSGPGIFSGITGLPAAQPLPNVITDPQSRNEQQGMSQQCAADRDANVATYLVLALIFILVQVIGWTMGNRTGFAGHESKEAWRRIGGFGNRKEYDNWHRLQHERIAGISQRHLASLQALIAARVREIGVSPAADKAAETAGRRTFQRYVAQNLDERTGGDAETAAPQAVVQPAAI